MQLKFLLLVKHVRLQHRNGLVSKVRIVKIQALQVLDAWILDVWLYIDFNWHNYPHRLQTRLESGPTDGPYQVSMINERYPGTNTSKVAHRIRKLLATNTSSINEQQLLSINPVTTSLPLASVLECEIQKILSRNGMVVHGPDSPEHLHAFSMLRLMDGLKQLAPTLFDLLVSLGDTKWNHNSTDPDETET